MFKHSSPVVSRSSRRFARLFAVAGAALACLAAVPAAQAHKPAHGPQSADITLQDIELRPGVTTDIHVRVLQNPYIPCSSNTVLAVHGALTNAAALEQLGQALFDQPGRPVCRFVSVDLPGHGLSSLPDGTVYGDLSIDDYAAAVLGAIPRLHARGIRPNTLMGYSMGGLVVQIAQQALVDRGTSLHEAFRIKNVTLLAPAVPAAIPCAFCNDPQVPALLSAFMTFTPALGPTLHLPDQVWPAFMFTSVEGALASDAPSPQQVASFGYNSAESVAAAVQLVAVRPDIHPDIFSRHYRTKLRMISFEHDRTVRAEEAEALYTHLTGEDSSTGFTVIVGDNAVHGMPISDPEGILVQLDDDDDCDDD